MSASSISLKNTVQNSKNSKKYTWEEFKSRFLSREDGYKYEWVNGFVEKTPRTMDKTQFYIIQNLQRFFRQLLFENKANGELITEGDTFFVNNHRRPDIAYYTDEQIQSARDEKNKVVPKFVIEIISNNDQMNRVHAKMDDYRAANVEVIWHILPLLKEIHVYNKGITMKVCKGGDICSASPVLPDFNIKVNDILN
ncbi:MAG TPA: Uma2 family endonuclease [Allocoleopsis sp.]